MKNLLHYKDYIGSIEFSEEDGVFFGKVLGIKDLISFEGDSVDSLTADFQNSVNIYLDFCEQHDKIPEKPYKGSFNVRIGADLHRDAALKAISKGISLNALVAEAINQTIKITE
jgi:predicted HicB family RNase H-like nuclease